MRRLLLIPLIPRRRVLSTKPQSYLSLILAVEHRWNTCKKPHLERSKYMEVERANCRLREAKLRIPEKSVFLAIFFLLCREDTQAHLSWYFL